MWETISKIVPPPLLVGFMIYAAIAVIWLQPAIEQRMSDIQLIPACKSGTLPDIGNLPAPRLINPDGGTNEVGNMPPKPSVDLPLALQIIMGVKGITGGAQNYDPYAKYIRRSGGDACACSTALAFDAVYFKHLGHVMSLAAYSPYDIRHIDERVAVNMASGNCGTR